MAITKKSPWVEISENFVAFSEYMNPKVSRKLIELGIFLENKSLKKY